jgi:hypothetical protein
MSLSSKNLNLLLVRILRDSILLTSPKARYTLQEASRHTFGAAGGPSSPGFIANRCSFRDLKTTTGRCGFQRRKGGFRERVGARCVQVSGKRTARRRGQSSSGPCPNSAAAVSKKMQVNSIQLTFKRLHAISLSFYGTELERITVVQTPKELDPRMIVWKGASILARLETSSEFWVTTKDWVSLPESCGSSTPR